MVGSLLGIMIKSSRLKRYITEEAGYRRPGHYNKILSVFDISIIMRIAFADIGRTKSFYLKF
jgi:hypothetical protein